MSEERNDESKVENKTDNKTYPIEDKHADTLMQHARTLNYLHALIGAQVCEAFRNIEQANNIDKNISIIQEDIAKELQLPRGKRLNWNLTEKYIEIVEDPKS